jgi:hypothetical protein
MDVGLYIEKWSSLPLKLGLDDCGLAMTLSYWTTAGLGRTSGSIDGS